MLCSRSASFDQNHADIAGHGQGHFLEVLRLLFLEGGKFHLGKLADAIDQLGDSGPNWLPMDDLSIPVSSMTSCNMAAIRL